MLEINITQFITETCPRDYSASCAEMGDNAGALTWSHAVEDSTEWNFLDTEDKRDAFRAFVCELGGWTEAEIAAWSDVELNALCIQWIAGDIRECLEWEVDDVWANYQEMAEAGQVNSNLYRAEDGSVYWSV